MRAFASVLLACTGRAQLTTTMLETSIVSLVHALFKDRDDTQESPPPLYVVAVHIKFFRDCVLDHALAPHAERCDDVAARDYERVAHACNDLLSH